LITLLLVAEKERTSTVSLRQFWMRRARRLLPALYTMMLLLITYTAIFRSDALGKLRGDVIAGLFYVSNWYQIWVGQGYTASGDFAPLRHLWSLAVEEQFYLIWPLVMFAMLRVGSRRIANLAKWLLAAALVVTALMAILYYPGQMGSCDLTPDAYWMVGDRCISINDTLYLSTITRAGGLLFGAAFALIWRPFAIMRGPLRRKGHLLDLVAVGGLLVLAALTWFVHFLTPEGTADAFLFRGGFMFTSLATLAIIAAVTHRGAFAGPVLGNPVFLWIGTRSYGLYLYHWPIYQIIRRVAGRPLTVGEFVTAMVITVFITEASYRIIETPIRKGTVGQWWRRLRRSPDPTRRTVVLGGAAVGLLLGTFGVVSLATAEVQQNEIEQSLDEGSEFVQDPFATDVSNPAVTATTVEPSTTSDDAGSPSSQPSPTATAAPGSTASVAVAPVTEPATTAAPTTAPPAPAAIPQYALGDSVMLGAAGQLTAGGYFVDAVVSRAFVNGLEQVIQLHAQGMLGDVVVVHLGTNGPIKQADMDRMMSELAGVRRVVLLTNHLDKSYTAGNNAMIY
ncbi:MAG TPA: acyltransferase family protein, partial [Ilumatobacteraceae bacterium]